MKRNDYGGVEWSRTVGYIRVSSDEQAEDGISLDAQRSKIESYCYLRGYDLRTVFCDAGVSGYTQLGDRDHGRGVGLD